MGSERNIAHTNPARYTLVYHAAGSRPPAGNSPMLPHLHIGTAQQDQRGALHTVQRVKGS